MNDSNISLTKEVVNDIFIRKALPLVALTIICAVVGTFGNVFVLYIHIFKYQRCTFRCFVLGLCAVDLTSSVIIVPLEVYNYMNWFIFPSAGLCGFKAFMNVFLTVSSVYVLLMIAIDRYLKVCAPHRQQLTPVLVLKCYCLCFFLACGQSWPILKIWSQRTIVRLFDLTPVKISMCLAVHGNDIWRKVFTALLIPTYIALFGMLVIYIIVGKRIFGVLENMRRQSTRKKTLRRKHFVDVDHKVDNRKLERASSTSQKESSALESTHESKEKGEHLDNTSDVFSGKVMIYTIKDNNVVLKERKSVDGMSQKDLFLQKRKLEERSSKLLLSRASSAPMSSSHRVSVSNMSSDVSGLKKYASTPVSTVTNSNSETSDSETMSFGQINDSDNGAKTIEDDGTNNQLTVAFSPVLENTVRRKSIFTKRVKFNFSAREKLKRRTLITFIFTAIFIVSSLTNIILQSRMTHLSERTELSSYSEILVDFAFFKLYFINFVIHPILYGILDPRFRKCMRQTSKQFVFRS